MEPERPHIGAAALVAMALAGWLAVAAVVAQCSHGCRSSPLSLASSSTR